MLAIACLMIEALESFRQGWANTRNRSHDAFCRFFDSSTEFPELRGHVTEFYRHIRCGLLHQAESTGGWRVLRRGKIFDPEARTVNAAKFVKALRCELDAYCALVAAKPWENQFARNARKKLNAICSNATDAA